MQTRRKGQVLLCIDPAPRLYAFLNKRIFDRRLNYSYYSATALLKYLWKLKLRNLLLHHRYQKSCLNVNLYSIITVLEKKAASQICNAIVRLINYATCNTFGFMRLFLITKRSEVVFHLTFSHSELGSYNRVGLYNIIIFKVITYY